MHRGVPSELGNSSKQALQMSSEITLQGQIVSVVSERLCLCALQG